MHRFIEGFRRGVRRHGDGEGSYSQDCPSAAYTLGWFYHPNQGRSQQRARRTPSVAASEPASVKRLMAPGSSPSLCGGVRIKLLAALAAGVFFGFGVCDLFMRLTAAPVPPLRLTAASTTITTATSTTVTHPRGQKAASSLRQPPPRPSAARGVVAQSSSLPSSLPRPARHDRAPGPWSASPCPANCSSQCATRRGRVRASWLRRRRLRA